MDYREYFIKCRESYGENHEANLHAFYEKPTRPIPTQSFNEEYARAILKISAQVYDYFTENKSKGDIFFKYPDIWSLEKEIKTLSKYLVPHLEKTMYGCHLYVDKVYIFRTASCDRESSYIWHYDNNPNEIVKNIIYLNDVNEFNSPFEYLSNPEGEGVLFSATRKGPEIWNSAPNGSRIPDEVKALIEKGYRPKIITGPKGTGFTFNNNVAHRANPVEKGYRDIINIRVKPTLKKIEYINKKYTTSFETSGVVNPNPQIIQ